MARPKKLTTTKQIAFDDKLLKKVTPIVDKLGLTFTDYVRNLVINDVKEFYTANNYAELATKDLEGEVDAAMADYKSGKYVVAGSASSIDDIFERLDNGD